MKRAKPYLILLIALLCLIGIVQGQNGTVPPLGGEIYLADVLRAVDECAGAIGTGGMVILYDVRAKTTTRETDESLIVDLINIGTKNVYYYKSNGGFGSLFPKSAEPRLFFMMTNAIGKPSVFGQIFWWQLNSGTAGIYYLRLFQDFSDAFDTGLPSCSEWRITQIGDSLLSLLEG